MGPWNAIRCLGDRIWAGDPVHPSADAYDCVAGAVVQLSRSTSSGFGHPKLQQQSGRGHGLRICQGVAALTTTSGRTSTGENTKN